MELDKLSGKAALIKMIVLDNDGVMTDGKVFISAQGIESKAFAIRDGFGVVMARQAGISFGIITGLLSPIVEMRARQLGILEVHQGFTDKLERMRDIVNRHELKPEEVAYMGDDMFDLPVMRYVGLGAAPADAHPLVAEGADWVSAYKGGEGAVRELIELILKARGQWDWALKTFVQ
jgi:3-deoxy-D-manno-octulosonate 8-phosphate phosphatase (KDO 8-P phosphatase)